VPAHHVDLPVALVESHDRDVMVLSECPDVLPEPGADLLQDRRRRDAVAQMPGHEPHDLTAYLQFRHIPVQIDPIQALHIQHYMIIKQIVHRHRRSHTHQPGRTLPASPDPHLGGQRRRLTGLLLEIYDVEDREMSIEQTLRLVCRSKDRPPIDAV
jgi:hypothetical protein